MYKLDLPVDMKESAAIERRRQRELERQSRIFNAKVRTIGVCYFFGPLPSVSGLELLLSVYYGAFICCFK